MTLPSHTSEEKTYRNFFLVKKLSTPVIKGSTLKTRHTVPLSSPWTPWPPYSSLSRGVYPTVLVTASQVVRTYRGRKMSVKRSKGIFWGTFADRTGQREERPWSTLHLHCSTNTYFPNLFPVIHSPERISTFFTSTVVPEENLRIWEGGSF